MDSAQQIKQWSKELKALAQNGLAYSKDPFDQERFHQLYSTAMSMASHVSTFSDDEVRKLLPIEVGYTTPKIAVRGVVWSQGKVLLVKESADGRWCLPGGWCDIDLTPSENIVKEIEEEAGIVTRAVRLLAFYDQTKNNPSVTMQHIYTVYFLCEEISGEFKMNTETSAAAFFDPEDLPELSIERMSHDQLRRALHISLDSHTPPYFD